MPDVMVEAEVIENAVQLACRAWPQLFAAVRLTCPLTHITGVAASREMVNSLTDADTMSQVLVRVGVAPVLEGTPPTPRRPLDDVLR